MKHILRKLHIGGGHDSFDSRVPRLNSAEAVTPQDSSVTPTSSGFSGWLSSARHSLLPSSSGNTPRSRLASAENSAALGLDSPHSEERNPLSFNYYEEEYQVQLALALSVSGENTVDDPDSLQIRAAKRISLGRPPSPGSTPAESMARRYWNYNVLDYDEKVVDGFYDVYGVVSDFGTVEKMPSLVDLERTPLTDMLGYEVVLVNRGIDFDLVHLEQAALCLAMDSGMIGISPLSSELVQKIAELVVQHMGGPVVDANDILRSWRSKSYELRSSLNNIVLPLGCLKIGLSRHRALLFKVLADHVGIPCRLVKGSHYTGTDEGAVNVVKLESEREYIVDLMGAPGTLLPAEMAGATGNVDLFENAALVEELFSQIEKAQNNILNGNQSVGIAVSGAKCKEEIVRPDLCSTKQGQLLLPRPLLTSEHHLVNGHNEPSTVMDEVSHTDPTPEKVCSSGFTGYQTDSILKPSEPSSKAPMKTLEDSQFDSKANEAGGNISHVPEHTSNEGCCAISGHQAESRMQNINQRLNSGYMECWTKHVNNKGDPMLENVATCEITWEEITIGERIGLGSYGEVYLGEWHGTEVAVKKFLDQDFFGDALDEFISEVRIMRRMQHPNVVVFVGAVTRPPNLSIVTEYLPRGSLFRLLHRPNCQLDERLRLKMALDVAEGMDYLHTSKPIIVHRDLKSPNLLVDKNWVVKVCDFGLSRLKHHTFLSSKSTAGTPEWMAPEVLRNEPSTEKCDVYSFGVILWELSTLQQPWNGMNPMQVVGAVGFQNRRLEIPKNVEQSVARIIIGCWHSDPRLRPSFSEITVALKPLERLLKD